MTLSVCIATYRRTDRLRALLDDLCLQEQLPDEVIIVDNDVAGTARVVVQKLQPTAPFPIRYDIQPERNIALTRNRTVALAQGEWVAFIDDDERPPAPWLRQLMEGATANRADAVLGPVLPQLPADAPHWIRRGDFYTFPRSRTGTVVPLNRMRFGNVLLRGQLLRGEPGPFDPAYGLSTGEDGDLLVRLARHGARIIWCDEAVVWEPVERRRLSLRWLLYRALSGGQEFAHQTVRGRYGAIGPAGRATFFLRALLQLLTAAVLTVLTWPLGRHRAVGWLLKASANYGKLTAFWGARHRAYA